MSHRGEPSKAAPPVPPGTSPRATRTPDGRTPEPRVLDLDRIRPCRLERVCESAIEHQADIVVVLNDPTTFVVLDGDRRGRSLDPGGCPRRRTSRADRLPHRWCIGPRRTRQRFPERRRASSDVVDFRCSRDFVARSATVGRSSIKKSLTLLRPLLVAKPESVNAQRGVGANLHLKDGLVVPTRLDQRGFDGLWRQRCPQSGRSTQLRTHQCEPVGLSPRE